MSETTRWDVWPVVLTPLVVGVAAVPGVGRWALPLVAPLTLYPALLARVRREQYEAAWQLSMVWAALLSLGVILLTEAWPQLAAAGILHGEAYRVEMFGWIATGVAAENDWRQFVPIHLTHLALFALLSWISASYLGLVLGAGLVGYMSYFVGAYAASSGHPVLGAVAAWVPWSVVRVAAFVLLGCLLARPLLARRWWPFERRELRLMALVAVGLLVDLGLKALLAPAYGRWLAGLRL